MSRRRGSTSRSTKANSKEGHTWGTELSEADKASLLEYLKSL